MSEVEPKPDKAETGSGRSGRDIDSRSATLKQPPSGKKTKPSRKDLAKIAQDARAELLSKPLPATESDSELSRQGIKLGFLIHDVSRLRRAAYDQLMKPMNVTRARWWVLAHLSRHDGMMQSQLADVLEVGKASLGTMIEQLETAGWVERHPDPSDKRAKRVYLSRSAQSMIRTMTQEEDLFNRRILGNLSLDDQKMLFRLLSSIRESLLQMDVDGSNTLENV